MFVPVTHDPQSRATPLRRRTEHDGLRWTKLRKRGTSAAQPDGSVSTYSYQGDGLRRTAQEPGQPVRTMVWDGGDYLGEI